MCLRSTSRRSAVILDRPPMQRGVPLRNNCTLSLFNHIMDSETHFFITPHLSDYAALNTHLQCTFYLNSLLDDLCYCSSCADMLLDDAIAMTETFVLPMHLVLQTIYDNPTRYWCTICTIRIWACVWITQGERDTVFPGIALTSGVGNATTIHAQPRVEVEHL